MINLGSTSIADVKFGSQQISKAYFGSDLVFEKDEWMTLKIGTKHSASEPQGIILAQPDRINDEINYPGGALFVQNGDSVGTSAKFYGFTLSADKGGHYGNKAQNNILSVIDGVLNGCAGYAETGSSSTTYLNFYLTFPFDINISSITATKYNAGYIKGSASSTVKHPTSITVSTKTATGSSYANIASTTSFGSNSITIVPQQNDKNIRVIRFYLNGYSTTSGKRTFGEFQMEVQVKKSTYEKWKRNNNLTTNANIP